VEKRYCVWCEGSASDEALHQMRRGILDDGEFLRARDVRVRQRLTAGPVLEFVLTEGRKREIRRLCDRCNLTVQRLVREAVGPVTLAGLGPGAWRALTDEERTEFLHAGEDL